jgi:uncharacterized protein YukE
MSRPAGEPAAIAAGSRRVAGAAGALRDVAGRLRDATASVVVARAWRGPASEAYLAAGAGHQARLERAADALDQAAAALSELAARLEQAQATWDRAHRLAASAGVALDPRAAAGGAGVGAAWVPDGGVRSPVDAVDPAAMLLAGQAIRMAAAAEHEAAAARRVAAARLDQAAAHLAAAGQGHGSGAAGSGGPGSAHGTEGERHGGPVRRVMGRVLEVGAEAAMATHHVVVAAEARLQAAARLAATADDPAVRAAAARVAQSAGRPMMDGRVLGALPLVAPILDFSASMSHGEPWPRALTGAVGSAIGADLGGRIGLAACGGEAAATQGAGLVVCPTLTAVGGAFGAHVGKSAALHVYDELAGPPEDHPRRHPEPADAEGRADARPDGPVRPATAPGSGG